MKHPLKLIAIAVATSIVTLVAMCFLPSDRYVRWQMVRTEAFARLGWIYERAHEDPTPINVAFLGTSHTLNGVDANVVARGLWDAGVRDAQGRCPTAVNIAVPAYGRNLHWAIAKEALNAKKIDLLVVEILENETRKPHPLYAQVADPEDIIGAPVLLNLNYAIDVARLPFRQLMAAMKSVAPEAYGLKSTFDPADYDGSTVDNVTQVNVDGKALTPRRDITEPKDRLDKTAAYNNATKNLNMLPKQYEAYEYAVPNRYVREILDLAQKKGARVVFLYLPGYRKPERPYDTRLYQGRGDMLFPMGDLRTDPSVWLDADHLNIEGAETLSRRLPALLAPELEKAGWGYDPGVSPAHCSNGYPPRKTLLPFRRAPHG